MDKTALKARATRRLKIGAMICLGLLVLYIIGNLLRMYQTGQDLDSPLISHTVVQRIQQFYLQQAIVSSVMLLLAVGMYLLKRYWYAILLVAITLVGSQYMG